jgi:aspartyl/asparaginyl beta-hydroxylase (cupin superfamily)
LLATGRDALRPFTQSEEGMPLGVGKALVDGRNWGVLALCEQGWVDADYVRRCPRTWETLLRHAPVPRVPGWGPSIVFSLLKAGAHIGAHTGMYNTRLICHLPLIVPPGCRFRVGAEVREWEVGKLLIFDDTIEHEAWNGGPEDRVVLIFDIWRPELTEQEKRELTLLFSD